MKLARMPVAGNEFGERMDNVQFRRPGKIGKRIIFTKKLRQGAQVCLYSLPKSIPDNKHRHLLIFSGGRRDKGMTKKANS